jgi:hypothetical protein
MVENSWAAAQLAASRGLSSMKLVNLWVFRKSRYPTLSVRPQATARKYCTTCCQKILLVFRTTKPPAWRIWEAISKGLNGSESWADHSPPINVLMPLLRYLGTEATSAVFPKLIVFTNKVLSTFQSKGEAHKQWGGASWRIQVTLHLKDSELQEVTKYWACV